MLPSGDHLSSRETQTQSEGVEDDTANGVQRKVGVAILISLVTNLGAPIYIKQLLFYPHHRTWLLILEREVREKERDIDLLPCMCPDQGPNLKPRHVL